MLRQLVRLDRVEPLGDPYRLPRPWQVVQTGQVVQNLREQGVAYLPPMRVAHYVGAKPSGYAKR